MEKLILNKTVEIDAPISMVWKALTDPDLIKKYFYGTEVTSEWEKGKPIIFRGIWDGIPYEDKGMILEIVPEKLFIYNYWSNFSGTEDIPENYANISYKLDKDGEKTILTVTQDGFKTKENMEHSLKSWDDVLNSMKEMVEKHEVS